MPKRSVIVLPDDTGKPIVDAINAAKKSLRIKIDEEKVEKPDKDK